MAATADQVLQAVLALVQSNTDMIKEMREEKLKGSGKGGGEGREWKKKGDEKLNWRALGDVEKFKGGETEWGDWKFKFLTAVGTGSLPMRKAMTYAKVAR